MDIVVYLKLNKLVHEADDIIHNTMKYQEYVENEKLNYLAYISQLESKQQNYQAYISQLEIENEKLLSALGGCDQQQKEQKLAFLSPSLSKTGEIKPQIIKPVVINRISPNKQRAQNKENISQHPRRDLTSLKTDIMKILAS